MRLLTPTVRMTPVMGVQDGRKVKEPGAAFVPFVMEPEQKAEEKRWIKDGITHIFSIGKYEERKNHRMLVEIVEELSAVSNIHLTITGERTTSAHQAYYDRLAAYIADHGLQDKGDASCQSEQTAGRRTISEGRSVCHPKYKRTCIDFTAGGNGIFSSGCVRGQKRNRMLCGKWRERMAVSG